MATSAHAIGGAAWIPGHCYTWLTSGLATRVYVPSSRPREQHSDLSAANGVHLSVFSHRRDADASQCRCALPVQEEPFRKTAPKRH